MTLNSRTMSGSRINLQNASLPADLWANSSSTISKTRSVSTAPVRPVLDINKAFLASTIRNVESHNRFEEVQDCWRQKDLNNKNLKRRRVDDDRNSEAKAEQDLQRQLWAEKKAQTQAVRELLPDVSYVSSSRSGFGDGNPVFEAPPSHGPLSERSAAAHAVYSTEESSSDDDGFVGSGSRIKEKKESKEKKKKHKKDKKESKKDKKHSHSSGSSGSSGSQRKEKKLFQVKLKEDTSEKLKQSA